MIFADIVKWLYDYDKRVLVLMDREQLVQQTAERLHEYLGAQIGIACASLKRRNVGFGVTCASRQTLAPMLRNGNADAKFNLVILDEAHLYNERKSGQYAQILAKLWENHKDMRVFGCTATPYNLRGNIYGVGKLFETVDFRITAEEMIQQGYLVPLQWKVRRSDMLRQLDLVEKSSTGELDESQQSAVLEQKIFVDSVYDIWSQYARDRKCIVFCLNISHAEKVAAVYESNGVPARIIHSRLPQKAVRSTIADFKSGTGVIVNCSILTIGSDIPSASAIILARRTLSASLFVQIIGRLSRPFPGKSDGLILDLCGSSLIFGIDPDNPVRQFSDDADRDPPIKVCPLCETAVSMRAVKCLGCGFLFPVVPVDPEAESKKIKDHGPAGELVDFQGFVTEPCSEIRSMYHLGRGKTIPCVEIVYRCGSRWVRDWQFPQHPERSFPQKRAGWYWFGLGGRFPVPKSVKEWIARGGELAGVAKITFDASGKYAVVKKVEKI